MRSELEKLEKALKELERLEEIEERRSRNLADWSDPHEKKAYIAEYKRNQRAKVLPNPRVCPCCNSAVMKQRSWVVFSRTKLSGLTAQWATRTREKSRMGKCAVCRSCAMKHLWSKEK